MATTLANLQPIIADLTQQANIDITTASNLTRLNRYIVQMAALHKWPEFRFVDESLATIIAQEGYTIPTTRLFHDITLVSIKDPADDNKWKPVMPVVREDEWDALGNADDDFPELYLISISGTTHQIQFRPNPDFAAATNIRITGYVEPREIDNNVYISTEFRTTIADKILAELFSADLLDRRVALKPRAKTLFEAARIKLSRLIGREVMPEELHIPKE